MKPLLISLLLSEIARDYISIHMVIHFSEKKTKKGIRSIIETIYKTEENINQSFLTFSKTATRSCDKRDGFSTE